MKDQDVFGALLKEGRISRAGGRLTVLPEAHGAVRRWLRRVFTPTVYPRRWQDRLFMGHVNLGPITIYGANAMHWAINVRLGSNWWCFHPRTRTFGGYWPWYFYVSRDATPQEATFKLGDCYS